METVSQNGMDLIIKPTDACNFACTFCSSPQLADDPKARLHLETVFEFLERFPKTKTIIVNGGDPTMMPVEYYWEMISHIEEKGYDCNISITSNLWKFYLEHKNDHEHKKWTELFKHSTVSVITSFNYGETRRISKERNFTESDFIAISDLFLEHVGYRPHFISVIDESNISKAVDNVRLARSLDIDCKLNYAMASGHQTAPLPLSKIYEVYISIWREGLADWEWNTRQMANRLTGAATTCPLNRSCDAGIRVLHPDGKYYSCGAFADDDEAEIDYQREVKEGEFFTPLRYEMEWQFMKEECLGCPMFDICNGCYKHVKDIKRSGMVETHCTKMKSIANDILDINYKDKETKVWNQTYKKPSQQHQKQNADTVQR